VYNLFTKQTEIPNIVYYIFSKQNKGKKPCSKHVVNKNSNKNCVVNVYYTKRDLRNRLLNV